MKRRQYFRIRIGLMTFALGVAVVYFWNGMSIAMCELPVTLPRINSDNAVLFVISSTARDASPYDTPTEDEIIDGRDLSLYDVGGYIESCGLIDELAGCLRHRESARQFIFDHWTQQRRGYIQVAFPCVDCGPIEHIFVEPDSKGKMRIVITLETNGQLRTDEASGVKFRRANTEEQRRSNSSSILVFLDRSGKEIDYF